MFDAQCDVAALVYQADQDPDGLLMQLIGTLQAQGLRPVGLVQRGHHDVGTTALPARMIHSGVDVDLFQEAVAYTRGRRLDLDKLAQARSTMMAAIDEGADLLVVNRSGGRNSKAAAWRD